MSDVKIEQKQTLSRQDAARFIAALAEGLGDDGMVTVQLGNSTLELSVASQVDCELEVAVDGDEIELELELKWSTSGRPSDDAAQDQSQADDIEEAESDEDERGDDDAEAEAEADSPEEARSDDEGPSDEAAAGVEVEGGESGELAAESSEANPGVATALKKSAQSRRGRRRATAATGKPAFNGVDTAAVRAWAAANGVTVSPRGRIKDEVIEAYRAAGD